MTRYCEWLITVPKGRRVKIQIIDFDVKPTQVLVLNSHTLVPSSGSRLSFYNDFLFISHISTITGSNTTPSPIYSSDNTMAIAAFIQRTNVGHRGFKMRFSSYEPTICEGNLNGNNGTIQSPANASNFYCEFIRSSRRPFYESNPNQGTLAIKIIEEPTNRTTCLSSMPTGILVTFLNNEKRLFYTKCPAKYDTIASPYINTKLAVRYRPNNRYRFSYKTHNCGGILNDASSNISSPTFDHNYGEVDCAWQYTSNTERNIQMIITARSMNCETEYLNYYRGTAPNRPRVGRICSNEAFSKTITVAGQSVFIEYHSDNYNPSSTFQIGIVTSDGICGGTLSAPNYVFSSPKNGTKYPSMAECEWLIQAQSGYHIGLHFTQRFMIEPSPDCNKDYVQVFVKNGDQFNETGRYCGRDYPSNINSTGRVMKVVFRSDDTGDGDGFTAVWAENCGGVFRATEQRQVITSPRYPENYPKNVSYIFHFNFDLNSILSILIVNDKKTLIFLRYFVIIR